MRRLAPKDKRKTGFDVDHQHTRQEAMKLICDATHPGLDHTCRCSRMPCTGPHFCCRCGAVWADRYQLTDAGYAALTQEPQQ